MTSPSPVVATQLPVNALDYGLTADGDQTAALNAAADAARASKRGLFVPDGFVIQVEGTVNFRYIKNLTVHALVRVGPAGLIVIGDARTQRSDADITIRRVEYVDRASQSNECIRVVGLKQAQLRIGMTDYLQLWADASDPLDESISYNTIFPGNIRKLEFYCRKGSTAGMFGWITECLFVGGDFKNITVDSDYIINGITFLKPCIENAVVTIPIGHRWSFIDARGEGGTQLRLGADSSRIIWEDQFVTNPGEVKPGAVLVQDDGFDNVVTTSFERHYKRRTLLLLDTETPLYDASASVAVSNIAPGLSSLTPMKTFAQVLDTGLIPVRGRGEDAATAFASQWSMPRLSVASDTKSFRYTLSFYSTSGELVDPGQDVRPPGGATWNASTLSWSVASNVSSMMVVVRPSAVAFIRLVLTTGSPVAAFSRLEIVGWLTGASNEYPVELVRRRLACQARQDTPPTAGLGPVGTRVQGPDREWMITSRADTQAGDAAVGATSITVASVDKIAVGDSIGIALTGGGTHWATITSITGTTLGLSKALPSACPANARAATARWH